MAYVEYETSELVRIPWIPLPWQQAWAVMRDAFVAQVQAAVRCGWIQTCPPDALAAHARASQFIQGYFEDSELLRLRLLGRRNDVTGEVDGGRWNYHRKRGTREGMIEAVSWALAGAMGRPVSDMRVEIRENPEWNRAGVVGIPADIHPPFWIIIRHPHPFGTTGWQWDDGTKWGEKHWGSDDGDPRLVYLLEQIARHQKPVHAQLVEIIIILAGDIDHLTGEPTTGSNVLYWRVQ